MVDQAASLRKRLGLLVPVSAPRKRVIATSGGKGGVGKSTVAVNLAVAYGALGSRTLLFDGDLGMADLNLLLGRAPERTIMDVLRGMPVEQALITAHGVELLPSLNGSFQLANLDERMRRRLARLIARLVADFETTVIDTAAGIHQSTVEMTALAGEVLLVATPEPLSLADAYACLKVLATRELRSRVYLVPNAVRSQDDAEAIVTQLSKLAARFLGIEVIALPAIPHDPAVPLAAALGIPLIISQPDSPASRAIRRVARTLDELSQHDPASRAARAKLEALAAEARTVSEPPRHRDSIEGTP